jgi:diguanylate cyclase (GGDEF)-like protein
MDLIPANETERLAAIRRYEILDTPADGTFDRLTVLAARLFSVPIAIVSLVDHDRIWFKSHYGLDVQQIGRDPGLCASAILQNEVYTVLDAKTDPRTLANPLVAAEFGLRFYAAAPLITRDGCNLGTLCIMDFKPSSISESEKETLKDLASIVMDEMELRLASRKMIQAERTLRIQAVSAAAEAERLANTDKLTGLGNRRALDLDLECFRQMHDGAEIEDVVIAMMDLNGLKVVNDRYGHKQGDWLLISFANNLRAVLRQQDKAYRYGGDEFVLLLPVSNEPNYETWRQRIALVVERVQQAVGFAEVGASVGFSRLSEKLGQITEVLQMADERMYSEKRKRKPIAVNALRADGALTPPREFIERRN